MSDIMDGFENLVVRRGDEAWSHMNDLRRRSSKVTGEESRTLRNEQSNIRKDIARVRRDISRETDPVVRRNLEGLEDQLTDLQRRMRQSNMVDGIREYNYASSRLDAMRDYVRQFKGKKAREAARKGGVASWSVAINRMSGYMLRPGRDLRELVDEGDGPWVPGLADLYQELNNAIRDYDSDQVHRVIARIHNYRQDHGYRGNRPQDIDEFDRG